MDKSLTRVDGRLISSKEATYTLEQHVAIATEFAKLQGLKATAKQVAWYVANTTVEQLRGMADFDRSRKIAK